MTKALAVKQELQVDVPRTPIEVIQQATEQANALMNIVEQKKLYAIIQGKRYLEVEAWEVIGAFNRVSAITDYVKPITGKNQEIIGYEAKVNLFKGETMVGSGVMTCGLDEFPCKGKEGQAKNKAAISAAQTWATSKAYRLNYSWVAVLAGYQPVPAEEMTHIHPAEAQTEKQQPVTDDNPYAVYLECCPEHGDQWKLNKFGKRYHQMGDEFCNFSDKVKAEGKRLQSETGLSNEEITGLCKTQFGHTYSKLSEEEQVKLLWLMKKTSSPLPEPEIPTEGEKQ